MSESTAELSQKNVYTVLGAGRSGTSAIASGLNALGIDFGNKLKQGDNEWNPKGFWEDLEISHKINRGAVNALQYSWKDINEIDRLCQNNNALHEWKKMACDVLKQRMSTISHWGFKDPTTAKILPFWQDVFATLNVNDHYVIALR